jgi:hypothetical protein
MSIRRSSVSGTSRASRGTKSSPRSFNRRRRRITDTSARRGEEASFIPQAARTERITCRPSSMWPLIRSCSAARRWNSRDWPLLAAAASR